MYKEWKPNVKVIFAAASSHKSPYSQQQKYLALPADQV